MSADRAARRLERAHRESESTKGQHRARWELAARRDWHPMPGVVPTTLDITAGDVVARLGGDITAIAAWLASSRAGRPARKYADLRAPWMAREAAVRAMQGAPS